MTQQEFTSLVATCAAGLAPIVIKPGSPSPERLAELASAATDLAQQIYEQSSQGYQLVHQRARTGAS